MGEAVNVTELLEQIELSASLELIVTIGETLPFTVMVGDVNAEKLLDPCLETELKGYDPVAGAVTLE